jgi:hypothetical protein
MRSSNELIVSARTLRQRHVDLAAQNLRAVLLAAAARIGANPAVRVMAGVPGAFVGACTAGCGTGFKQATDRVLVGPFPPRQDAARDHANVGAIEIETNALAQVRDHVFPQARIGAGGTGLRAVVTGLDAADLGVRCGAFRTGMRPDHFHRVHMASTA